MVENGKKQIKIKPAYYVNYTGFTDKETVVSLRNLTEQKYNIKHDLKKFEAQLKTQKDLLRIDSDNLLLSTDFEAKGLTNQKKRDAYVNKNPAIKERKEKIEKKRAEIDKLRMDYDWACDELENYKLLIRLEISRRQAGQELLAKDIDWKKLCEDLTNAINTPPLSRPFSQKFAAKKEDD